MRVFAAFIRRAPDTQPVVVALHHAVFRRPLLAAAVGVNQFLRLKTHLHRFAAVRVSPAGRRLHLLGVNVQHLTIYRISPDTAKLLIDKPESGLGYQVVRYQGDALIIFNATIAIPLEELRARKFSAEEYVLLSGDPDVGVPHGFETLSLDNWFEVEFSLFGQSDRSNTFGLSLSETVVEPPEAAIPFNTPQSYYRYSAYSLDRRVDPCTGNFLSGTYATTYADMHFVPSGFAAVGRYALPNPASARYVFQVVTNDRPSLMGTATPNFGQAGGGVEVLFSQGATNRQGISFPINVG